jgi:hypothetical protein
MGIILVLRSVVAGGASMGMAPAGTALGCVTLGVSKWTMSEVDKLIRVCWKQYGYFSALVSP